jgi:hypothetical protein
MQPNTWKNREWTPMNANQDDFHPDEAAVSEGRVLQFP